MTKKQPLLIIEDDPVHHTLLEKALSHQPYSLTLAGNADEAFRAFEKLGHRVVLCDIHLPGEVSGTDILRRLMQAPNPPVVIMITSDNGTTHIIETFKLGAQDYLIKPVQDAELQQAIRRAFDLVHTRDMLVQTEKARLAKLEQQLATKRVTDLLIRRQNDKFAKALFGNIHTSFTQGKGIGALTTLVSMLAGSPLTPDGRNYQIPKDVLDMIFENQSSVNQMIDIFGELQLLVSQDFVLHEVMLEEFHKIIGDIVYELQPLAAFESHRLVLSELAPRFNGVPLHLNWEFMRKAIRELLLNAMKFSPPGSPVTVLVESLYTRLLITILNSPLPATSDDPAGIPEEFRRVIFDPFFRISRVVHERYGTLEYGLGLTYVEKVIQMHKGSIRCLTVEEQSGGQEARELIAFEIELPL